MVPSGLAITACALKWKFPYVWNKTKKKSFSFRKLLPCWIVWLQGYWVWVFWHVIDVWCVVSIFFVSRNIQARRKRAHRISIVCVLCGCVHFYVYVWSVVCILRVCVCDDLLTHGRGLRTSTPAPWQLPTCIVYMTVCLCVFASLWILVLSTGNVRVAFPFLNLLNMTFFSSS